MSVPLPSSILLERLTSPVEAFTLYHYLSSQGLPVKLWERPLRAALGEIPFLEAAAELYLEDASRVEEARRVIRNFRAGRSGVRGIVWTCPHCGETHEPEFGACWNCGLQRP